jgi:hypothetical protein
MKKMMTILMLTTFSIIFALLLCELIIRVTGAGSMTISREGLYRNDPDVGWVCTPNIDERFSLPGSFDVRVVCNSKGLRDAEKDYAKPAGIRRIAVLGDSFVWGYGVENQEMVSTVLQNLIPDTETLNFGVKGYSTVQEVLRFETEALRYEPVLTLLFFCWNDLEDNFDSKDLSRPIVVFENDDGLKIANRPVQNRHKSPIKLWFQHNVRVFGFARYSSELLQNKFKGKRRSEVLRAKPQTLKARSGKKSKNRRMEFSMIDMYAPPTPEMERAWMAMHMLLSKAKNLAERDGGNLIVVYVAMKEVMDKQIFATEMKRAGLNPDSETLDWDRPSNKLGEICAGLEIQYVDLTSVFRLHPEPHSLFLKKNAHWSAAGHRLAAETVAARIESIRK